MPADQSSAAAPAAAALGTASHTQTIAAPLHFAGNDPPLSGEISPSDFLRELEVRILGQSLSDDKQKLKFALNALQGKAHDWWTSLVIREDFKETYTYFKQKFSHKYRVPGYTSHEFDFSLIAKQKPEEDPSQYIARITSYVNNAAPAASFITWSNARRDLFNATFEEKFNGQDRAARTVCRSIVDTYATLFATDIQRFHIKHIWLNGLLQPYNDIAKMQDKDKELGALVDKVHDVGAARIKRANFPDHLSAMRAFKGSSGSHHHSVNATSSSPSPSSTGRRDPLPHTSTPPTSSDVHAVRSSGPPSKTCNYCKKKGHLIHECRKRAFKNSGRSSGTPHHRPPQHSAPPASSTAAPAQKAAMEQLIKQWCNFVEGHSDTPPQHPPQTAQSQDFF